MTSKPSARDALGRFRRPHCTDTHTHKSKHIPLMLLLHQRLSTVPAATARQIARCCLPAAERSLLPAPAAAAATAVAAQHSCCQQQSKNNKHLSCSSMTEAAATAPGTAEQVRHIHLRSRSGAAVVRVAVLAPGGLPVIMLG